MSEKPILALQAADVPRAQRIFVNRNLRLGSVRAIGFDMDHTLAMYRAEPFEQLAFQKTMQKLVERGYSRSLLRLRYQKEFVVRGLIVDKGRGNILKMDRHHYVVQAYHGTRKIPHEMRKDLYTRERIRVGGKTYVAVDTLFSIPEISLYAQMVDLLDDSTARPNYRKLYDDVRSAIDEAHADGSIKNVIAHDPLRYLDIDPQLPGTLTRMRAHGVRLFLLTNSEPAYTALIMNRLLGGRMKTHPHWTDYFDVLVMQSDKPGFFVRHEALSPLAPESLGLAQSSRGRFAYTRGSVRALEEALGVTGDEILYFGDHTYGDIMRSKRICGWRTAMIIRSLEDEIALLAAAAPEWKVLDQLERKIDRLAATRDYLERAVAGEINTKALRRLLRTAGVAGGRRRLREDLRAVQDQLRAISREAWLREAAVEASFNPHWGPIFRAGRETSHFGKQVEEFACIYTSRVSNFLNYPMTKYFVTSHEFMPHER
ncbi:MAG: HAD-IG family 5'-nucleotidase [Candidatus Eisenbacteria bacterium]|nr:HAD-IG family 5'-nucleotidase [Candidatus Eisenbacteria bacterium]